LRRKTINTQTRKCRICHFYEVHSQVLGRDAEIKDFGMCVGVEEDVEALIILGRAVLNFLDLSGVKRCSFNTQADTNEKYAKMIGFKKENDNMVISLEGLFDSKCANCKE